MKKRFMMFTLLATAFSGMVHADDAAIRQSLAKLGYRAPRFSLLRWRV